MSDLYVAFYRNMNFGHRGSPAREMLETVLTAEGACQVRSFQMNGTVIMAAASVATASSIVANAQPRVRAESGYQDCAFVRSLAELAELVERDPLAGWTDARTYREMITFFDGGKSLGLRLPWTNEKDNVDIIEFHPGYALSVIRKRGSTVGSPTAELEARLGVPATSRTIGTLKRLVKALH